MIAGAAGDDSCRRVATAQFVEGPAELEGAGALEILRLQDQRPAQTFAQASRGKDRGAPHHRRRTPVGILECGELELLGEPGGSIQFKATVGLSVIEGTPPGIYSRSCLKPAPSPPRRIRR